ncbi:MAG: DUF3365 domain-containing protein [Betaproteobacteria bacterium]|nr:DUF3365 domain-containing protein [Betaproteobacteria bacterium]
MKLPPARFAAALIFALSVASTATVADEELARFEDLARKAASQIVGQVRGELVREMERTGPIRSVIVCKYSAPEIASAISRSTGMRVTRVSLRPRNRALGEADAWEQRVLLDFEKRLSSGEKIEALETVEVVREPAGTFHRYMKAIQVSQPCLACHGTGGEISDGVRAQLAAEYPNDVATGYRVGQLRGAVSVKKRVER